MFKLSLEYDAKLSTVLMTVADEMEDDDLVSAFIRKYSGDNVPDKIWKYDERSRKLIWAMSNIATGDIAFALWRCDRPSASYFAEYGAFAKVPGHPLSFQRYLVDIARRFAKFNL